MGNSLSISQRCLQISIFYCPVAIVRSYGAPGREIARASVPAIALLTHNSIK